MLKSNGDKYRKKEKDMKVVMLESLGVSEAALERHVNKLADMGHEFVRYEKDTDPAIQAGPSPP